MLKIKHQGILGKKASINGVQGEITMIYGQPATAVLLFPNGITKGYRLALLRIKRDSN